MSGLKVEAWDTLLALEGLFIQLATNLEEKSEVIGFSWTEAESHVTQIVTALATEDQDVCESLMAVAKDQSDYPRQKTCNKVWLAKWTRRMADMVASFRKQLDSDAIMATLTKHFLIEWETPTPRAQGVCFEGLLSRWIVEHGRVVCREQLLPQAGLSYLCLIQGHGDCTPGRQSLTFRKLQSQNRSTVSFLPR